MKKLLFLALLCSSILKVQAQEKIPYRINHFMTTEDKLYALSKVWSEAKYNEAFLDNIGERKWDSTYQALIKPIMNSKSDNECYRLLTKYCAMLKDGHSSVFYKYNPTVTTFFDKFQIVVQPVEGRAFVSQISCKQSKWIPVGSEITEVNGKPTAEYLKAEVMPYKSSSTQHHLTDVSIKEMFQSLRYDHYAITFITPKGESIKVEAVHDFPAEIQEDPLTPTKEQWKIVALKWLKNDIAYVAINSFNSQLAVDEFEAILPELKNRAKKLVIDVRNNNGGNTNFAKQIYSRLTPDNTIEEGIWYTRTHNPAFMSWGKSLTTKDTVGNIDKRMLYNVANHQYFERTKEEAVQLDPNRERVVVPTAILIGHQTFSTAENFLVYCANQPHITLLGEKTAGSTGNPTTWALPYGGTLEICTKKDVYPNGREFVGYGIEPDIESHLTVEDFRRNKDTVLEAAIKYLEKKKK